MLKRGNLSPVRRATLGSLGAGIAGQLALLISGIISARILGAEDRGYLALYVAFPTILVSFFSLGLPQALTFWIAANKTVAVSVIRQVYLPVIGQLLLIALLHTLVVWLYQQYDPAANQFVGYLTIAIIPGMLIQQYGQSVLQGLGKFRAFNISRLMMPMLYATTIVALYVEGEGNLTHVATIWVAVTSLSAVLSIVMVRTELGGWDAGQIQAEERPQLAEMLKFGLKGLLGNISPIEILRLDQLIAGLMLSPAALGLYVVAQAFMTLPRFIGQSVGMIVYPVIAGRQGVSNNLDTVWRVFWFVGGVNATIIVVLIVCMPFLLPLLFGQEFDSSVGLAQVMLVGALFVSMRRPLVEGVRGLGFPEISTYAEISMYPWLLLGLITLVPYFGLTGLAVTISFAFALALLVATTLVSRIRREGSK